MTDYGIFDKLRMDYYHKAILSNWYRDNGSIILIIHQRGSVSNVGVIKWDIDDTYQIIPPIFTKEKVKTIPISQGGTLINVARMFLKVNKIDAHVRI